MRRSLLVASSLFLSNLAFCQPLPKTAEFQNAIKKGTRTLAGKPGKNYWQNSADYSINVSFDPGTKLLSGDEWIKFSNNSPDTIKKLIIRIYPDLYKKGVKRSSAIAEKDQNDGVNVEVMRIGNDGFNYMERPDRIHHDNTLMFVELDKPILPRSVSNINVKWHYTVNSGSQNRTGMVDSTTCFIAYFFPRISVLDDIDGWDDWSYNGSQEFYNDFGNFNVNIKVPFNYVVWATGERKSEEVNLGPAIIGKLNKAKQSADIVHVIDTSDYANNAVINSDNTGVWKFSAEGVSDFAFALSDHYLWDASTVLVDSVTKRTTLASAAFNPTHKDYFDVANQAHQSVYLMSFRYPKVPFPFPYITVFDGTDQMEYPMIINDNPTDTHKDAVQLTSHEIFHSYFPFYMGINETKYAWMDEGWATIGESVISPLMGEPEDEGIYSKGRYERISGTENDSLLITNTKHYEGPSYLANSYGKGGLCYWVLQDMLGDALYFKALHQYMNDWHGKHPTPYDFFYSFNTATKKNLDWFWKKWFYEKVFPDLAITNVLAMGSFTKIVIGNKGGLPVPVYITLTMNNGTTKTLHYGANVWQTGKKIFTVYSGAGVRSVTLGNEFVPDKDRSNNRWDAAGL